MVRISEDSFKIRKIARFYDLNHIITTTIITGYLQKFQDGLQILAVRGFRKPIEEISQKELNACLYVSTHLRGLQLQSSSMKSVRAAAIMFLSVARRHSAKHLHKCARLLRFSISLKLKNLHWMFVSVRLSLVHLGLPWNCPRGILFLRSAPHSKTYAQMRTNTLLDELELQKHMNICFRKVVTRTLESFLNLRCPALSHVLRFPFFIQLRSQSDARVM